MNKEKNTNKDNKERQEIVFTSARELLLANTNAHAHAAGAAAGRGGGAGSPSSLKEAMLQVATSRERGSSEENEQEPAIASLRFPFELKPDQVKAAKAWMESGCRGSVIYGSGTGKTEIAWECARRAAAAAAADGGERSGRFNILLLVPRVVLVEQNVRRLARYGIAPEKVGRFFGEGKEVREITVGTYHSATANPHVVRQADMVIFDEVHLASNTARAFSRIFDIATAAAGSPGGSTNKKKKALLGLTATIDEQDPRNSTIMSVLPPVRKYLIGDAVADGRLARPVVVPIRAELTKKEQKAYDDSTVKIRRISARFKRYDLHSMAELLSAGGFPSWQARAWLINVRKRKRLLASADNKLAAAVGLVKKHEGQRVMVFSETLESVRKLRHLLAEERIESRLIDSSMPSFRRQKILSQWGSRFYPLLSVHTLEIGYDVPEVAVEIILASTSNMNQVVQRIGRVVRKAEGKDQALVYVAYVSGTKDDGLLAAFQKAVESTGSNGSSNDAAPASGSDSGAAAA